MTLPVYDKPQISVHEQIELLKSEGLPFYDEEKAIHLLENISLFRMKSYLMPLRQTGKQMFKQGAAFEEAYSLYKFDSELRKMICSEMEKIEVSIRTRRLWNRRLSINALIPRHTRLPFVTIPDDTKKVYYVLSIILYFLQTVNPKNTFASRFKSLLAKYPMADIHAMGFSVDWQDEPLWK